MGRKKQKLRWTSVEEKFFESESTLECGTMVDVEETTNAPQRRCNNESYESAPHYPRKFYNGGHRRYGSGWSGHPIAPRFERKAQESRGYHSHDSECDDQAPNGFTKIRSKNLDVLFKKDYYTQRVFLSTSQTTSTAVSSEHGDDVATDDANDETEAHKEVKEEERNGEETQTETKEAETEEKENENEKENEKENEGKAENKKSTFNGHANPFFPTGYFSPSPPMFIPPQQTRPNLFLYSPNSNTIIPCEEIVIPNHMVGPEGETIYQPNVYLAYPAVDSNGAMISPGAMGPQAYPQYMSAGSPGSMTPYEMAYPQFPQQAEHVSAEMKENISTEQASDQGTEPGSAESTTPHSPPDLSVYSPANWVKDAQVVYENIYNHQQWYPQQVQPQVYGQVHYRRFHYRNYQQDYHQHRASYISDTGCEQTSDDYSLGDKNEQMPQNNIQTEKSTNERSSEQQQQQEQHTNEPQQQVIIPGLPRSLLESQKRTQKKRRKKKGSAASSTTTSNDQAASNAKLDLSMSQGASLSSSEENLCPQFSQSKQEEPIVEVSQEDVIENDVGDTQYGQAGFLPASVSLEPEVATATLEASPERTEEAAQEVASAEVTTMEPETAQAEPEVLLEILEVATLEPEQELQTEKSNDLEPEISEQTQDVSLVPEAAEIEQPDQSAVQSSVSSPSTKSRKRRSRNTKSGDKKTSSQKEDEVRRGPESAKKSSAVGTSAEHQDQWETIPPELELGYRAEKWETSTRSRKSRKGGRHVSMHHQVSVEEIPRVTEIEPEVVHEPTPEVEETQAVEATKPEEEVSDSTSQEPEKEREKERSLSAPGGSANPRGSKKSNRKKRPSLEDKKPTASSVRPVLIQEGMLDLASGFSRPHNLVRSAADILTGQALMIKDIGHGMKEGPITLGRLRIGKYSPPDRSDEILSSMLKLQDTQQAAPEVEGDLSSQPPVSGDLDLD